MQKLKVKKLWRTEREVKAGIKKVLDRFKKLFNLWYYMAPASIYGRSGVPDFVVSFRGRMIGIEAKRPDKGRKGLTALQLYVGGQIVKSSSLYWVVWNEDTVKMIELMLAQVEKTRVEEIIWD